MTSITVNVIRKFSGSYTYTLENGVVTSKTTPKEPETFRRVTRAQAPAQTSPAPAAKITTPARVQADPLPVETVIPVNAILPAQDPAADYPKFQPLPLEGTPEKHDRFTFVTLNGPIYNGFRLPLPEAGAKVYPVYMVVNQDGALMQTLVEGYEKQFGWHYRSGGEQGIETARGLIIDDIKRLRTWQRKTYGKQKPEHNEVTENIQLPARGTLENFQAAAADLYRALKDYGKKAFLVISGYLFKAHILAEVCKLAGNEQATCMIIENSGGLSLCVQLGKAIYNFRASTDFPSGAQFVTCSI